MNNENKKVAPTTLEEENMEKALIENGLKRKFLVYELDLDSTIDLVFKLELAYAVGLLKGKGSYGGYISNDETWIYECRNNVNKTVKGGVAVVNCGKIIDYHEIYEKQEDNDGIK